MLPPPGCSHGPWARSFSSAHSVSGAPGSPSQFLSLHTHVLGHLVQPHSFKSHFYTESPTLTFLRPPHSRARVPTHCPPLDVLWQLQFTSPDRPLQPGSSLHPPHPSGGPTHPSSYLGPPGSSNFRQNILPVLPLPHVCAVPGSQPPRSPLDLYVEPGHPAAPPTAQCQHDPQGPSGPVTSLLSPCRGSSFFCGRATVIPTVDKTPHDRPADSAPLLSLARRASRSPGQAGTPWPCCPVWDALRQTTSWLVHYTLKSLLTRPNLSETCATHNKAVPPPTLLSSPHFPTTAKITYSNPIYSASLHYLSPN